MSLDCLFGWCEVQAAYGVDVRSTKRSHVAAGLFLCNGSFRSSRVYHFWIDRSRNSDFRFDGLLSCSGVEAAQEHAACHVSTRVPV